jgi:hypothetical protein
VPSALVLHCVSWKVTQGLYVPVARMALHLCTGGRAAQTQRGDDNETTDYHHGKVSCGWKPSAAGATIKAYPQVLAHFRPDRPG